MDLRQVFIDFKTGKSKNKRPRIVQEVTPKRKGKMVTCPHCEGEGIEPGSESIECHVCRGTGLLKKRELQKYEREKGETK